MTDPSQLRLLLDTTLARLALLERLYRAVRELRDLPPEVRALVERCEEE